MTFHFVITLGDIIGCAFMAVLIALVVVADWLKDKTVSPVDRAMRERGRDWKKEIVERYGPKQKY